MLLPITSTLNLPHPMLPIYGTATITRRQYVRQSVFRKAGVPHGEGGNQEDSALGQGTLFGVRPAVRHFLTRPRFGCDGGYSDRARKLRRTLRVMLATA